RRMVRADFRTAFVVDLKLGLIANLDRALHQPADMRVQRARLFQRVLDDELRAVRERDHAMVTRLAAALRIERRTVEHERSCRPFAQLMLLSAAGDDRRHRAITGLASVAEEFVALGALKDRMPDRRIV